MKGGLEKVGDEFMLAGGLTGITAIFGGWDLALQVFTIAIGLDILAGVVKGLHSNEFSSERMREGFATKMGYVIIVVLATQIDRIMPEDFPLIRTMTIYFYVAVEGFSIVENLAMIGVPVPKFITDRLAQVNGKESPSDKEEAEEDLK